MKDENDLTTVCGRVTPGREQKPGSQSELVLWAPGVPVCCVEGGSTLEREWGLPGCWPWLVEAPVGPDVGLFSNCSGSWYRCRGVGEFCFCFLRFN